MLDRQVMWRVNSHRFLTNSAQIWAKRGQRLLLPNSALRHKMTSVWPHQRAIIRFYSAQANPSSASQKFEFQAEINSLLEIVAKSLYSDQEVFIRELISNSSDALEKRRCMELGAGIAEGATEPFELRIEVDEKGKKLIFTDTGIGMSRDELVDLLGTIAKSGSKAFRANEKNASAESIIGQFGVGFYSAFIVSNQVTVATRKHGEEMGHIWTWKGGSHFEIEQKADAEVGTRIELALRPGEAEKFADAKRVIEVINKYSFFVTAPIFVNGERVNVMRALWTMSPSEATPEMHEQFFKHLTKIHHQHLMNDRPQYIISYQTDSPINIRALFYVPSRRVSNLEFASDSHRESGVSLYNQRVLVKPNVKELLPHYLRFLIGVIDSEDVPLNLSREMLQMDLMLEKLRKILVERCIRFFVSQMSKDRIKYTEFYQGYSMFFKEGIVTEQSNNIKEEIAKLLLFESSNFREGTMTSLSEYVERMQEDQKNIYYLFAPSRQLAETSPYFEMFKNKYEVLILTDPADELVFLSMPQFQMKKIQSLEEWTKAEGMSTESDKSSEITRDVAKKEFLGWLRDSLGSVRIHDIKLSGRQSEHPFMITVSADMSAARHMLRISEIKEMEHLVFLKPVLHVNISHPVVTGLMRLQKNNKELAAKVAEQIYDNALCTAGLLKDTSKTISRLNKIFTELLQMNTEKSQILTP